jgi:hypothetical protein
MGTQGASQAPGVSRHDTPHGCRCTRTFLGAPPTPSIRVSEATMQKPRAQKCAAGTEECVLLMLSSEEAASAVAVIVPSPLAGEGGSMSSRAMMGEGCLLETNPSPIRVLGQTIVPSPARGEGTGGERGVLAKRTQGPFRHPVVRRWLWVPALAALGRDDDRLVQAGQQPAGVRNRARRDFIVSGLLFTMTFATQTCRAAEGPICYPKCVTPYVTHDVAPSVVIPVVIPCVTIRRHNVLCI